MRRDPLSKLASSCTRKTEKPSGIETQHESGDLRKIKVCVNLRKVGHPTLRKLSTVRKGL